MAEDDAGQVMGLLLLSHRPTLWHSGPSALIEDIVVDERARGQGVGRALIEAGLGWARSHGCSEMEVTTEEENGASQAFFQSLGFEGAGLLLEREFED
jgi:GNAT superfamily N-acetyltransferase